jgi:hypothetical protein
MRRLKFAPPEADESVSVWPVATRMRRLKPATTLKRRLKPAATWLPPKFLFTAVFIPIAPGHEFEGLHPFFAFLFLRGEEGGELLLSQAHPLQVLLGLEVIRVYF